MRDQFRVAICPDRGAAFLVSQKERVDEEPGIYRHVRVDQSSPPTRARLHSTENFAIRRVSNPSIRRRRSEARIRA
jgi:hypothetical protein